jgi:beta-lactamase class A
MPLARYEAIPLREDARLRRTIVQSLGTDRGRFAVLIKNLADGSGTAIAPERTFYAASLFKIWVMVEAFNQREQGILGFGESYVVSDHYAGEFRLNPGELELCSAVSVEDALAAMIGISDNVAANMMLDRVGSSSVNATLASFGMPVSGFRPGLDLPTTAAEMALLLEAIARGQAVSAPAGLEMLSILLAQGVNDRLPARLPAEASVAHKTGNWANATHDAGVVFSPAATYVIVVLTDFGYAEDGASRIAAISRIAYDHYNSGSTALQ